MSQSTDALLYYGINIAHDEEGDYPDKFIALEDDAPDFFEWLESQVKDFNKEHSTEFEAAFHCCTNCQGYYITLGGIYQFRAWRGEPRKLDGVWPEVGATAITYLLQLALEMGVDDPASKIGWWLASYGEM